MKLSDDMQHQAKALADPSRFRLFCYIVEADAAVGVVELTELLGFNHNAIRQHLAILVGAGLVAETDEIRTVRGRPRKEYTARSDALHAFRAVSGSYERLAELLLEIATSDSGPYDVGYRAGHTAEQATDEREAVEHLIRQLTFDGFEPTVADDGGISLMNCPYADVAAQNQGVVCEIHRGLIDGHLAASGHGLTAELSAKDPHRAGCRVIFQRPPDRRHIARPHAR